MPIIIKKTVRKRKRSKTKSTEAPKVSGIIYSRAALIYAVVFSIFMFLPFFVLLNQYFNHITLFYNYFFALAAVTNIYLFDTRHAIRAVICVLTAIFACLYGKSAVRDAFLNGFPGGAGQASALTVVAYNRDAFNPDGDTFNRWLEAQTPDIVSIEEASPPLFDNYHDIQICNPYRTETVGHDDVMIMSRYPIVKSQTVRLGNRGIVQAVIKTPHGLLEVYGIHPQTVIDSKVWGERNSYLEIADQVIDPTPQRILVLGDFNATKWDPVMEKFKANNDLHEEPALFPSVTRILGSVAGVKFGSPIDHVLTNGANHLSRCRTAPAMGSDHEPGDLRP